MDWFKSTAHKLARWRRLRRIERQFFIQACLLLPLTAVLLRWAGLHYSRSVLSRLLIPPPEDTPWVGRAWELDARRTARMVDLAAAHALHPSGCLDRSLVLWILLRRQGIPGALRLGARRTAGRIEAHAWVEHEGLVLNDHVHVGREFIPFEALRPAEVSL